MRKLVVLTFSLSMLLLMGCTKQETKENLHNVGQGFKNAWGETKKSFSEGTEEFKDSTNGSSK